jgi:hypothetical protein
MLPRLHVVTDDEVLARPACRAGGGGAGGVRPAVALHLRGHGTSAAVRHALAMRLAAAALRTGAWLLVNDRIDIAMTVRANGVQLGAASLPVPDAGGCWAPARASAIPPTAWRSARRRRRTERISWWWVPSGARLRTRTGRRRAPNCCGSARPTRRVRWLPSAA